METKKLIPFSERSAADIYLEYFNDWLTVSAMAENYGRSENEMREIIDKGRLEHSAKFLPQPQETEPTTLRQDAEEAYMQPQETKQPSPTTVERTLDSIIKEKCEALGYPHRKLDHAEYSKVLRDAHDEMYPPINRKAKDMFYSLKPKVRNAIMLETEHQTLEEAIEYVKENYMPTPDQETIKGLSEVIESQKQTFDALMKKYMALEDSHKPLLEAAKDTLKWLEINHRAKEKEFFGNLKEAITKATINTTK